MKWLWSPKRNPLEWHIPNVGLVYEKPPCGRWKYLGSPLGWANPRSFLDRQHVKKLDHKGIVVTRFRLCTSCGRSEILGYTSSCIGQWEEVTFEELMRCSKEAEIQSKKDEIAAQKSRIQMEQERLKKRQTYLESEKRALQWLKREAGFVGNTSSKEEA